MTKKKLVKFSLVSVVILILGATIYGVYMYNLPKRDIQASEVDFELSSTELVNEYLLNDSLSNEKYLEEEGDSKILSVTGPISSINKDLNGQLVVLLKLDSEKAGVSCTFLSKSKIDEKQLRIGQVITVKGVIRSGAGYDGDLEMYEDVIMEKCDLL